MDPLLSAPGRAERLQLQKDAVQANTSAYRADMSERQADPLSDADSEDWTEPVRIDERTVNLATWHAWAEAAQSATRAGVLWGAFAALALVVIPAGVGLLILLPSPTALSVLIYSPMLGLVGWSLVSARVRRARFTSTGDEMKGVMVPELVRTPWIDELHKLASTRRAHFVKDFTVCRVEDRLDLYAIRIFEYSPDQLGNGVGETGGGFGGGGGDGGGGGC
jgi:hypothetical protein